MFFGPYPSLCPWRQTAAPPPRTYFPPAGNGRSPQRLALWSEAAPGDEGDRDKLCKASSSQCFAPHISWQVKKSQNTAVTYGVCINVMHVQNDNVFRKALWGRVGSYWPVSRMATAAAACTGWWSAAEPLWRTSCALCCCHNHISDRERPETHVELSNSLQLFLLIAQIFFFNMSSCFF